MKTVRFTDTYMNPFNGIESPAGSSARLPSISRSLGIHSMELKGAEPRTCVPARGGNANPFNGIESSNFSLLPSKYSLTFMNPFNGIERHSLLTFGGPAFDSSSTLNPFNGIERHSFQDVWVVGCGFESIQWN